MTALGSDPDRRRRVPVASEQTRGFVVRRIALSCLLLTLPGCAIRDRPVVQTDTSPVAAADSNTTGAPDSNTIRAPDSNTTPSSNMRRVMGEPVAFAPLTPEPGDIWADLAFLKQRPSTATQPLRQATRQDATAPARSAGQPTRPAGTPAQGGPAAPSATLASPAGSAVSVQLAAASSEQGARAEWQRLQRLMPQLIAGRVPSVRPVNADGHELWRLRTGGFATPAEAAAFCTRLQTERSRCWVVAKP
jgi:hypothetical protein